MGAVKELAATQSGHTRPDSSGFSNQSPTNFHALRNRTQLDSGIKDELMTGANEAPTLVTHILNVRHWSRKSKCHVQHLKVDPRDRCAAFPLTFGEGTSAVLSWVQVLMCALQNRRAVLFIYASYTVWKKKAAGLFAASGKLVILFPFSAPRKYHHWYQTIRRSHRSPIYGRSSNIQGNASRYRKGVASSPY